MANKHINNKSFSIGCIEIVKKYEKKLGFASIFNRFKTKADKLSKFVVGFVSHKIHYNQSINHSAEWMNQPHILDELGLKEFEPKTAYRNLATLGRHDKSIVSLTQNRLQSIYEFENTNCNMDWSSLVLYGNKANLGEQGYSRDHRPDKKQITFGISEYANPINVPMALTVQAGNILDKQHFPITFKRTLKALNEGSLIIIDRGANTKDNKALIRRYCHHYLCATTLSQKVDEKIKLFDKQKAILVEEKNGKKIYCQKYFENNEYCFLFFSEKLYEDKINRKKKNIQKRIKENKEMQDKILSTRKKKQKTHQLQDFIAIETVTLQKRLEKLSESELGETLFSESMTGREGFFLLVSSKDLTHYESLKLYRERDSVEKMMDSLKNVIRIKPVRVWMDDEIKGALLIGFFAQLIISLMKYENENLRDFHPKTIVESIRNLTLTLEYEDDFAFRKVISNIDAINQHILGQKSEVT
jgi:transposase